MVINRYQITDDQRTVRYLSTVIRILIYLLHFHGLYVSALYGKFFFPISYNFPLLICLHLIMLIMKAELRLPYYYIDQFARKNLMRIRYLKTDNNNRETFL